MSSGDRLCHRQRLRRRRRPFLPSYLGPSWNSFFFLTNQHFGQALWRGERSKQQVVLGGENGAGPRESLVTTLLPAPRAGLLHLWDRVGS